MLEQLSLNTAGEIIAAIIFFLIGIITKVLYTKVIHPWLDHLLYKGPKFEGHWNTTMNFDDGTYNKYTILLQRYGHSVSGIAKCIEGHAVGYQFEFKCEIFANMLFGTYRPSEQTNTERGSLTMMLVGDGKIMQGYMAYSDDASNRISAVECIVHRSDVISAASRS